MTAALAKIPGAEYFLGIDPGKQGALAWLCEHGALVYDMPPTPAGLIALLKENPLPELALVEDVGAMTYVDAAGKTRGQGAAASFVFGYGAGVIEGALRAFEIPLMQIKPSVWKLKFGLSSNKDASRALASQLFPAQAHLFSRKKDDGRAEAVLLARYAKELACR